jgi:Tfp pilus assembly protein PilN
MARDFYLRFLAVFFIILGCSFSLIIFTIFPSYFLAVSRGNLIDSGLETQQSEPIPEVDQKTLATAAAINQKLDLIEQTQQKKFLVSQKVISELVLQKMSDIKISQIFYEDTPVNGKKISIRGTAPSRERLLLFRLALEDSLSFQKVDLPISNFVKGSNIEFSLDLIP